MSTDWGSRLFTLAGSRHFGEESNKNENNTEDEVVEPDQGNGSCE